MYAIALVVAVLVAGQVPAVAKGATVYHGEDYASVHDDQMYGAVCDAEADGLTVGGTWHLISGDSVTEDDGDDQGCDEVGPFEVPACKVEICEEFNGCRVEHL